MATLKEYQAAEAPSRAISFPSGAKLPFHWHEKHNMQLPYEIEVRQGGVHVSCKSRALAEQLQSGFSLAAQAGHIAALQEVPSTVADRWLWLPGERVVHLKEGFSIALPSCITQGDLANPEEKAKRLKNKLFALGYNGIIFGARRDMPAGEAFVGAPLLGPLLKALHQLGVETALQPMLRKEAFGSSCPVNPSYSGKVKEALSSWLQREGEAPKALIWWSRSGDRSFHQDPAAVEYLHNELILEELHLIEKAVTGKCKLFFYLNQSWEGKEKAVRQNCLTLLCEESSKGTHILFSASANEPTQATDIPHPFLNDLRQREGILHTPLLPILNLGGVGQGEGLWPCTYVKEASRLFQNHHGGMIALANTLPELDSLLGASLWAGAHFLLKGGSPESHLETWVQALKPNWKEEDRLAVNEASRLAASLKEIQHSKSDEGLKNRLSALIFRERVLQQFEVQPDLRLLLTAFSRDFKRIVGFIANQKGVALGAMLEGDINGPGFWTSLNRPGDYTAFVFNRHPEAKGNPAFEALLEGYRF